jgi:polyhydroxyalkanoate synthesis regulator phasin
MAENERIKEMKKHKKDNSIVGDLPTMMGDILEELADLRAAYDALERDVETLRGRVKNIEDKPKQG